MTYKLILLDGDETLWTFDAQEFIWASLLKPPLKKRTQDSLLDQDASILMLREGARAFLEWAVEEEFYLNLHTHNDFHIVAEVLDILELWDYFEKPKINWQKKNKQLRELLDYLAEQGIDIQPDEIIMVDDNPENYYDVENEFGSEVKFIQMGTDVKDFKELKELIQKLEAGSEEGSEQ